MAAVQRLLRWAPPLTVATFALPIAAGLLGTLLPAFGYLPAVGAHQFGLQAWQALLAHPGFGASLQLTLFTGLLSTVLSLLLALGLVAAVSHRAGVQALGAAVAPVLATPHSALAIGFGFLIAPSGWLVRWVSPGLTGWVLPPDVSTVGHPSGLALVACLLLKEVPYLVLMTLGALNQVAAPAQLAAARALGYRPALAFFKVVLPQVYPQIRLPVYAVLAFSFSVVDVAWILGPGNPPTLAALAVRWFSAPDVQLVPQAAAAAVLVLLLVVGAIGLWHAAERAVVRLGRRWVEGGGRHGWADAASSAAAGLCVLMAVLTLAVLGALLLWSVARQWRYPDAWPSAWTWAHWARQGSSLLGPAANTLAVGLCSTGVALGLVLACLENETQAASRPARGAAKTAAQAPAGGAQGLWLLYLPLLVPQVAFLFGAQVLLVRSSLDATLFAVIWTHLVFVLPYLFLSLAQPWRAFDTRYARSATSLGAGPWRVFWRIKLPILIKPTLIACAVAFAVSVGQYLPTLFAGSGRIATLTTEAVTLASGEDRRVSAVWALLQAALPFLAYALAAALPRLVWANKRGAR